MADIYSSAFLTIAVADALDANSRIACNYRYNIDAGQLLSHTQQDSDLLSSILQETKYVTRAWTFQERFLSVRCLYTLQNQVYIRCNSGVWGRGASFTGWIPQTDSTSFEPILSTEIEMADTEKQAPISYEEILGGIVQIEGYSRESPRAIRFLDYQRALLSCAGLMSTWALIVMLYSRKTLSFPSDICNAFTGIAERLELTMESKFLYGIPTSQLHRSLLWAAVRSPVLTKRRERTALIPTWSWMSHNGPVEFPLMIARNWKYRLEESTGQTQLSSVKVLGPDDTISADDLVFCNKLARPVEPTLATALPQHLMDCSNFGPIPTDLPTITGGIILFEAYTVPLSTPELKHSDPRRAARVVPCKVPLSLPKPKSLGPLLWWIAARRLSHTSHRHIAYILAYGARVPGGILISDVDFDALDHYCHRTLVELVAVSSVHQSCFERERYMNLLLIHWLHGHAERLGIAHVDFEMWKGYEPISKTIVLG